MRDENISFFDWNQGESGLPPVDKVPPAIQGMGGRAHTLLVANKAAAIAQSYEEHETWMHAWNQLCEPPWDGEGSEGIDHWIKDSWEFVRGENERGEQIEILRVAEQMDAELIVIGLRRRTPVGKLILGSNAQRILLDAHCPVLAVKVR